MHTCYYFMLFCALLVLANVYGFAGPNLALACNCNCCCHCCHMVWLTGWCRGWCWWCWCCCWWWRHKFTLNGGRKTETLTGLWLTGLWHWGGCSIDSIITSKTRSVQCTLAKLNKINRFLFSVFLYGAPLPYKSLAQSAPNKTKRQIKMQI